MIETIKILFTERQVGTIEILVQFVHFGLFLGNWMVQIIDDSKELHLENLS